MDWVQQDSCPFLFTHLAPSSLRAKEIHGKHRHGSHSNDKEGRNIDALSPSYGICGVIEKACLALLHFTLNWNQIQSGGLLRVYCYSWLRLMTFCLRSRRADRLWGLSSLPRALLLLTSHMTTDSLTRATSTPFINSILCRGLWLSPNYQQRCQSTSLLKAGSQHHPAKDGNKARSLSY